ncbi:hypothetical protein Rhe02_53530 [Rhizocola hellebori]|uniref:Uncharacterized protein n=1 Tax=Rhizocola hellebori TaxID=1392758 RepID=A0A8J3VIP8_9ACTN|nr:hypothetical protein Rhe02_53530 [Rhizocola hellebori]
MATTSYNDNKWTWGGRFESNSVSDAQQLLCLMFPATEISSFGLGNPDRTEEATLEALANLGGAQKIPLLIVQVLHEYLDRYTADDGTPLFSGGSHFLSRDPDSPPTQAQLELDVVESFAASVTLMLATISFARSLQRSVKREEHLSSLRQLEERAGRRLTAAMVGLLRSFTINTFEETSRMGQALLRSVNQAGLPERRVVHDLRHELRDVIAGLRDEIQIGSGQSKGGDLDSPNLLFECGWSWGVIRDAERVPFFDLSQQRDGVASDEPYLYFTMVALDAIADLFTERTRRASLLDEDQQRLARALQIRWDLTQEYWAVLADFGPAQWPLEDIPWRATDEIESDYLSVLVAGVAMRNLVEVRADDLDLSRMGTLLSELANRGRITRRPTEDDQALQKLHDPGFQLPLVVSGEAIGPHLIWPVQDYAAVLLKRSARLATMLKDTDLYSDVLTLMNSLWDHLDLRRMKDGNTKTLWDQPSLAYSTLTRTYDQPSWQMTVRVVESLVLAAGLVANEPLRSDTLYNLTRDMISEAEHLLDQEFLIGADNAGPSMRRTIQSVNANLQRAKTILSKRPASAHALVSSVLLELDTLAAAREDSTWAR